jgi:hypothetical protein
MITHTHIQDFRVVLPTLLGSTDNINETEVGAQKFQMKELMTSVIEAEAEIATPIHKICASAWERHKKMKALRQAQEAAFSFGDDESDGTWGRRRRR